MCSQIVFQKTVVAVLDRLINPHWPFLPEANEDDHDADKIERAWSTYPDDPRKYHFYYHILDADEQGRLPKNSSGMNASFDLHSWSCLHYIAEGKNKASKD